VLLDTKKKIPENIPPRISESLGAYVNERRPTGDFLRAVLENNLTESLARADPDNRKCLFDLVSYMYNEVPALCWGSAEKVRDWISGKTKI